MAKISQSLPQTFSEKEQPPKNPYLHIDWTIINSCSLTSSAVSGREDRVMIEDERLKKSSECYECCLLTKSRHQDVSSVSVQRQYA